MHCLPVPLQPPEPRRFFDSCLRTRGAFQLCFGASPAGANRWYSGRKIFREILLQTVEKKLAGKEILCTDSTHVKAGCSYSGWQKSIAQEDVQQKTIEIMIPYFTLSSPMICTWNIQKTVDLPLNLTVFSPISSIAKARQLRSGLRLQVAGPEFSWLRFRAS